MGAARCIAFLFAMRCASLFPHLEGVALTVVCVSFPAPVCIVLGSLPSELHCGLLYVSRVGSFMRLCIWLGP